MDMHVPNICLVSTCPIKGASIYDRLSKQGFKIDWIRNTDQALDKISSTEYDVVVSDICQRDINSTNFLNKLHAETNNIPPTLFISEHDLSGQTEKPLPPNGIDFHTIDLDIKSLINKLNEICQFDFPEDSQTKDSPLGVSSSMRQIEEKIQLVAPYKNTPVLINGESGVGKEIVARRLHTIQNPSGKFVAINCAAIPYSLIESELFGHERGAFTGSTNTHKGVFEQANGGTLLLDEIGEMPLETQAKLLRVIQDHTIVRLGSEKDIKVNLRIICATNCDLRSKVGCGEFREDLYYRINVIELNIKPLRKRQEDILWLTQFFLNHHSELYPGKTKKLDALARQALLNYSWPGNVRELKNTIERTCIMTLGSTVSGHNIFPQHAEFDNKEKNITLKTFLQSRERSYIDISLKENDWHIIKTASTLGISRKSLWEKMKRYDIQKQSP